MGDLIRFATAQWDGESRAEFPGFFADVWPESSGFNGFPFRFVKEESLGGGAGAGELEATQWPFEVSRQELAFMFWRVKKWRCHGSARWEYNSGPPPEAFEHSWDWNAVLDDDMDRVIDSDPVDPELAVSRLESERDILLYCRGEGGTVIPIIRSGDKLTETDPDDGSYIGGYVGIEMFAQANFAALSVAPHEDEGIRLKPYFAAGISTAAVGLRFDTIKTQEDEIVSPITGSITIMGRVIPLTFYMDPSYPAAEITGTFNIEPAEYWPYATTDGFPVWDTATGAQLNDPRS